MKCYVHHNADAVGVCTSCGRGVCRRCAVRVGGKIYCKEDARTGFSKTTVAVALAVQAPHRGVGVMLGSIFSYLLGGISGLVGCLLIFSAIITGGSGNSSFFSLSLFTGDLAFLGSLQNYPSSTVTTIGIVTLIFGFFGIAAGYYIWRPSKTGAVMAIAFGVLGLVGAFELNSISVTPWLVDAWFGLSGATIVMSFFGFVQLTREPQKAVVPMGRTVALQT